MVFLRYSSVLKEDIEEELRDEDLPVLPYKSNDKRTHF